MPYLELKEEVLFRWGSGGVLSWHSQKQLPDGWLHEELLEDGVHVAGCTPILEPDVAPCLPARGTRGDCRFILTAARLGGCAQQSWCQSSCGERRLPGVGDGSRTPTAQQSPAKV